MAGIRTAVVMFNLGGPDGPGAIEPFLINLFSDPAIFPLPGPLRRFVARVVGRRRAKTARAIYDQIGGSSPLLAQTRAQADALQQVLGPDYRVIVAMRYWHPLIEEAAAEVAALAPERVVLLPLYPQYSATTTGSALRRWFEVAGFERPTDIVDAYSEDAGWIEGVADTVAEAVAKLENPRVIFSAHGLPKYIVALGDPYPRQVGKTVKAVVAKLGLTDWAIAYQSRVGPLKWIGPSLDEVLRQAAADKVPVVVVPVSFVSEHSETLVELDIEYRHRAVAFGVPAYERAATVGCHPAFIKGLATLVKWNRA